MLLNAGTHLHGTKCCFLTVIKILWNIITKLGVASGTLVIKTDLFFRRLTIMCDGVNL